MTRAEEDALIYELFHRTADGALVPLKDSIRLSIRAAVAQERERIAKSWDGCMYDDVGETVDIGAAIRRG